MLLLSGIDVNYSLLMQVASQSHMARMWHNQRTRDNIHVTCLLMAISLVLAVATVLPIVAAFQELPTPGSKVALRLLNDPRTSGG